MYEYSAFAAEDVPFIHDPCEQVRSHGLWVDDTGKLRGRKFLCSGHHEFNVSSEDSAAGNAGCTTCQSKLKADRSFVERDYFRFGRHASQHLGSLYVVGIKRGQSDSHWDATFTVGCDCQHFEDRRLFGMLYGERDCGECVQVVRTQCMKREVPDSYVNRLRSSAKRRNIAYNLTDDYLRTLWVEQDRFCALSGSYIVFRDRSMRSDAEQTASLDRKDSKRPYEEGNVQWVHKYANRMKNHFSEDVFRNLCGMVADVSRRQVGSEIS